MGGGGVYGISSEHEFNLGSCGRQIPIVNLTIAARWFFIIKSIQISTLNADSI